MANFDLSHCMMGMQSSSDYGSYKDASKLMNGKKSRCKECEGCRAQDCGQCTYCLDKKKFGGQNVIKQACKFRICIRFKHSQKQNQTGSPSPNAVSSGSATNPSPMSPPSHKAQPTSTKHLISGEQ
ncbi:methylates 'Lys-4' of histone H3 [Tyrophagus putrescentiae]|nr:methylates 'Lys-4' of histone H3 [Tyrophagus putrescentiae]